MKKGTGIVIWLAFEKGYGFIRPDEPGEPDIFFHRTGCLLDYEQLRNGMRVRYLILHSDKGKHAGKTQAIRVELEDSSSGGMVVV